MCGKLDLCDGKTEKKRGFAIVIFEMTVDKVKIELRIS